MTTNEILKADLLDIIFEHRNKSYGAYTLRRYYNNRLMTSLGIAFSAVGLLFLISFFKSNEKPMYKIADDGGIVTVSPIEIPKAKEPEQITPKKQPVGSQTKVATIKIVPDEKAGIIADQKEIAEKVISDKTIEGAKPGDLSKAITNAIDSSAGKEIEQQQEKPFRPDEKQPSFPGGPEALALFFSNTLSSPDGLEAGEKRVIQVRFVVGADGSINKTEVIQSGGDEYDREVLRAFKRMPKWKPAIQNGIAVATSFTQPVTFVGAEQ